MLIPGAHTFGNLLLSLASRVGRDLDDDDDDVTAITSGAANWAFAPGGKTPSTTSAVRILIEPALKCLKPSCPLELATPKGSGVLWEEGLQDPKACMRAGAEAHPSFLPRPFAVQRRLPGGVLDSDRELPSLKRPFYSVYEQKLPCCTESEFWSFQLSLADSERQQQCPKIPDGGPSPRETQMGESPSAWKAAPAPPPISALLDYSSLVPFQPTPSHACQTSPIASFPSPGINQAGQASHDPFMLGSNPDAAAAAAAPPPPCCWAISFFGEEHHERGIPRGPEGTQAGS